MMTAAEVKALIDKLDKSGVAFYTYVLTGTTLTFNVKTPIYPPVVMPTLGVYVWDGVILADSVATDQNWKIHASDAITVGESTAIGGNSLMTVQVSDDIVLGESTSGDQNWKIHASDAITIGESSSVVNANLPLVVGDGVTIGELTSVINSLLVANVSDAITVGEIASADFNWKIRVSDGITVGDTVWADRTLMVRASDSVTISEFITEMIA